MKLRSYLLAASVLVGSAACSSTNPGGSSETATSGATGTSAGTDMNPTPTDASAGQTSADAAADATAFTATFATMQDPVFLMNAASSNMLEIRAGQMASQKASDPDVRKFAQMMVSHHMSSTQELKALAVPLGVQMPTTMMPIHQAMSDRLMNKSGKNFDETYMDMMETAHKLDIAMFEVKSKAAENPSVQTFASKTLPMLHTHEEQASALEKKVD